MQILFISLINCYLRRVRERERVLNKLNDEANNFQLQIIFLFCFVCELLGM